MNYEFESCSSKHEGNYYNGSRESIDFFRFCQGYEDVFVTESGELLYCSADMLGCPTMTASRLYSIAVHDWDEFLSVEESAWLRSEEETQADIAWLDSLSRAPEDVASWVIATESAFKQMSGEQLAILRDLFTDYQTRSEEQYRKQVETCDTFANLYELALKAIELGRAAFTYELPIAC